MSRHTGWTFGYIRAPAPSSGPSFRTEVSPLVSLYLPVHSIIITMSDIYTHTVSVNLARAAGTLGAHSELRSSCPNPPSLYPTSRTRRSSLSTSRPSAVSRETS